MANIKEYIAPSEPEGCKFKNATFQEKHFFMNRFLKIQLFTDQHKKSHV